MICVAFGLPGAGKSSLVKQAVDWECIELDTYTQFGHQLSKRHAWAKEKAEEIVKRRGKCIVDDNHYYSSMRHAYYKLAKKCKSAVFIEYINMICV
jgi:adenylate kinase family enzyme